MQTAICIGQAEIYFKEYMQLLRQMYRRS